MRHDDRKDRLYPADGQDGRGEGMTRRATISTLAGVAVVPAAAGTLYASSRRDPLSPSVGGKIDPEGRFLRSSKGAVPRTMVQELADLGTSPEQFGAIGDGVTDDTAALQAALDTGNSIRLTQGRDYLIRKRLLLSADGSSISGGGRIRVASDFQIHADANVEYTHMRLLFVTGRDVSIEGVTFDASGAPVGSAVENGFIWTTAPYTMIRDCLFIGNRKGTCIWALGDAPYLSVLGCRFRDCSGAVFARGRNSLISNNIIINATDAAIAINGRTCVGAVVANNTISNETGAIVPAMIAVEECASDWSITGNVMTGANGGAVACINILDHAVARGGVIANNVIDGRMADGKISKTRNPGAMISLSSLYHHWIVRGNTISSPPVGNPNSRLASLPATGGIFEGNILDGSDASGLSAMVEITPGTLGLTIRANQSICFAGGRHYLFAAGSYGNVPCRFIGGVFLEGEEGINAEMQVKAIRDLTIYIHDIDDCSAHSPLNAATILGDRAGYLNAGAWKFPHRIGVNTVMYCDTPPRDGGRLPFAAGDRLHFMAPAPNGPTSIVRVGNGWVRAG